MKTNPDDCAYPILIDDASKHQFIQSGLSKREYFATMAMQGLCVPCTPGRHNSNDLIEAKHKATMAVRLADTLIDVLNEEK